MDILTCNNPSLSVIVQHITQKSSWIVANASTLNLKKVRRALEDELSLPNGLLDDAKTAQVVERAVDAVLMEAMPQILASRVWVGGVCYGAVYSGQPASLDPILCTRLPVSFALKHHMLMGTHSLQCPHASLPRALATHLQTVHTIIKGVGGSLEHTSQHSTTPDLPVVLPLLLQLHGDDLWLLWPQV